MKSELFEMDREIVRWKAVLESGGGMLPEDIDELLKLNDNVPVGTR